MPDVQENQAKAPAYRWLVFGLLAAAYFMVYFHRTSPAVVALDMMADLKAGGALMGLLGSAYFYPYALMQLPAGLLSDSWGPRRSITVFFLLAGLASILFGRVGSVGGAIVARVLVGLGVSMLFVPTLKVLTNWFKKSEFAFMTGILMLIGGLGALSAAGPLAYLSGRLGWRGSFTVIGLVTLALAGAIWVLVRNTPAEKGLPDLVEDNPDQGGDDRSFGLFEGVALVLKNWRFWALAIWFLLGPSIFFAFGGLWGGPYLSQVYGLSRAQAGQILSLLAVGLILGSPVWSHLSDRILRSRKKCILISAGVTFLITIPLAFFPDGMSLGLLYLLCFLLGSFGSAIVVIGFTAAKELFPLNLAGTSVGLVNLFPFLGAAILQVMVGLVLERSGGSGEAFSPQAYGNGFKIFFFSALVALAASFLVKETLTEERSTKVP